MTRYEKAPQEITDLVGSIAQQYHPKLVDNCVTFDVLLAYGEDDEPAVKCAGYPAMAVSSINNLKARTIGHSDGLIVIDAVKWNRLATEIRASLIDHELQHFEPKFKDGILITDDLNRPKLRLRKHDVQLGWFDCVALRHGANSVEQIQARSLIGNYAQSFFPFIGQKTLPLEAAPAVIGGGENGGNVVEGEFTADMRKAAKKGAK